MLFRSPVDSSIDGVGHDWKLVRTFDDAATWSDPHVRQLSARGPAGPAYRTEPIPDQWELYDLTVDPIEAVNRCDDPAVAAVRAHLEATLERVREERVPARNVAWPAANRGADTPPAKRPSRAPTAMPWSRACATVATAT